MSNLKNQSSLNGDSSTKPKPINSRRGAPTTQSESNIQSIKLAGGRSAASTKPAKAAAASAVAAHQGGIVRQKNVGSNDILAEVSSTASGVGGGLRSVSTSATLANAAYTMSASGAGSKSMPAVTSQPAAASTTNRSNSGGSSSVNARLNMMAAASSSSSRRSQLPGGYTPPRTRREEFDYYYQKCLKGISHSINIIKATTMRLVFSLHSFIAVIYVYWVRQDEWYFLNLIGVVFLLIELFITIIKRKGKEPRWFFPCFFIYICTMIPPIWFVELTRIEMSNSKRRANLSVPLIQIDSLIDELDINDASLLSNAKQISQLDIATIAVGLEITLLMLVILGRWFLPKGNISRSTLSQLLLVYMSLASDIVDLLSLLNEEQVQETAVMSYFTLVIFSWSLFQFSLNLVVTRGRSFQSVAVDDFEEGGGGGGGGQGQGGAGGGAAAGAANQAEAKEREEYFDDEYDGGRTFVEKLNMYAQELKPYSPKSKKFLCFSSKMFRFDLFDSEIWSILITLVFQDGPFLALRLTAVISFNVRTFVTMFFTCKNAIILFLQFYRLSAICNEANTNQNDPLVSNKADALASLNMAASFLDKFVCLSYAQNAMIKSANNIRTPPSGPGGSSGGANKFGSTTAAISLDESEKRLYSINPILIRSTLSRTHSYAVVLTPNFNLNVSCCNCDCHPKDTTYL